jgi:serine/threonine-protein kinase
MAPEQARGRVDRIDERTDVYALGGTLYRLLTGQSPHHDTSVESVMRKARSGVVTPPEEAGAGRRMPPELCRIAMKALAVDPNDRYQSVEHLQEELESFLRGGGWLPTKTFADGDVILSEGEPADAAYIIVDGQCEAFKTAGDRRVSLRVMGPGEVFGEAAVFTAQPRTASVVARGPVTVKVVTSDSLALELSRNTWISALVKALADRFRELDAQLSELRDAKRP